jgi:hypothetical protein
MCVCVCVFVFVCLWKQALRVGFRLFTYSCIIRFNFNCCFTVHFDKYENILPTNALFIKNIKCYNVYLTPTCFGPSWTIIREYTFVPR